MRDDIYQKTFSFELVDLMCIHYLEPKKNEKQSPSLITELNGSATIEEITLHHDERVALQSLCIASFATSRPDQDSGMPDWSVTVKPQEADGRVFTYQPIITLYVPGAFLGQTIARYEAGIIAKIGATVCVDFDHVVGADELPATWLPEDTSVGMATYHGLIKSFYVHTTEFQLPGHYNYKNRQREKSH